MKESHSLSSTMSNTKSRLLKLLSTKFVRGKNGEYIAAKKERLMIQNNGLKHITSGAKNAWNDKIYTDDVSLPIEEKFNYLVMEALHRGRYASKTTFFFDIGYIFSYCTRSCVDIEQHSMKISCKSEDVGNLNCKSALDDIPCMIQGPLFERIGIPGRVINMRAKSTRRP